MTVLQNQVTKLFYLVENTVKLNNDVIDALYKRYEELINLKKQLINSRNTGGDATARGNSYAQENTACEYEGNNLSALSPGRGGTYTIPRPNESSNGRHNSLPPGGASPFMSMANSSPDKAGCSRTNPSTLSNSSAARYSDMTSSDFLRNVTVPPINGSLAASTPIGTNFCGTSNSYSSGGNVTDFLRDVSVPPTGPPLASSTPQRLSLQDGDGCYADMTVPPTGPPIATSTPNRMSPGPGYMNPVPPPNNSPCTPSSRYTSSMPPTSRLETINEVCGEIENSLNSQRVGYSPPRVSGGITQSAGSAMSRCGARSNSTSASKHFQIIHCPDCEAELAVIFEVISASS